MYDKIFQFLSRFFKPSSLFKWMFNLAPMYRRSNGKLTYVSDDMHRVEIILRLNYKNRNYVGTMFGGSIFAATDPIYMIQLLQILGKDYVVWDKASTIYFKRPVDRHASAVFEFSPEEIENIKKDVAAKGEIDIIKIVSVTDKKEMVFSTIEKTIYISSKSYFKEKRRNRQKPKES
ncbi:DUF4442 domain-containing protein [Reichenbachiella agarivorans]|uniref:DUF4442 domain-containing protein n=1 Tax=Reichenbachiella agarivorans TaxID=2979464 RepID=A0ABY6CJH2_9BACT|nr:DUF4442 domain-containing protein [Reichenbachiella agarivorans]UXP30677.1 DUF4442 domain-containing protein [Reichenbachiella agarivorans]